MHYHVLGLNQSSTEDDMKKSFHNLARRFCRDKNKHLQASDLMIMINEDKVELEDTLRDNDNHYPHFHKRIEQIIEQIFHYVPV